MVDYQSICKPYPGPGLEEVNIKHLRSVLLAFGNSSHADAQNIFHLLHPVM